MCIRDSHPEEACNGPLDLHLALEVDPRVLLSFEDAVVDLAEGADPPDDFHFPLTFTWALPPLPHGPDLLHLAIDLAGIGGVDFPVEASAIGNLLVQLRAAGQVGDRRDMRALVSRSFPTRRYRPGPSLRQAARPAGRRLSELAARR